ncbi:hypothetical protein HMPREF9148_00215 [Prevotella sp. F0091]|nr:hypothetical protein HMPREF9148_00215 [Prevotella sp. F0091]
MSFIILTDVTGKMIIVCKAKSYFSCRLMLLLSHPLCATL